MAQKVLIFSTAYLPLVAGAEIAVKELTDRLAGFSAGGGPASGWEFDLICARIKKELKPEEKIGSVNIYRLGGGWGWIDKFLLPILGLIKAIKLNGKNSYKIIWSIMASQASVAAAFLKIIFSDKKLVLNLQEGDEEEHLKRYALGNDLLYKILIRPWHLLVFKKADYITAISADLKNRAGNNGAKVTVEIIPNGVDLTNYKSGITNYELRKKLGICDNEKVIITVSRLVKKNGVGDLIEAMRYLPADVKLLIIGNGELESNFKVQISNLKLDNRVIMLGAINNEVIPEYLAIADIFIRPSLSEGQGIAFLEAMAAGVPVIATPVGGIVDFLRDPSSGSGQATGLFCEVRNPKSIAEKVKMLLENKELTEKIKINAKELVIKNYDWNLIAEKMKSIFEKIVCHCDPASAGEAISRITS
jgi:glycosyltransferase involved in cell wall biosynthesis